MKSYLNIFIFLILIQSFQSIEEDLVIESKALGAELTSIKYKNKEYLHDGLEFWHEQSPILFPIVGKLRYDKTTINGANYTISKHGFAKGMVFEEIGKHSYRLNSSNETLKKFPFDFELYVSYTTEKNKLFFNYTVINKTPNQIMLFGIGGHPGFKCDYYKEKSSIVFEKEENKIKVIPVDINAGLMSNEIIDGNEFLVDKKIFNIKNDSFENDAVVFTDIESKSVILKDNGKNILKFNFEQFKYLGIWSANDKAPYVCLEPWYNTPDYVNSTIEFEEKKDIIKLEYGKKFEVGFSVEFFDNSDNTEGACGLNYFPLLLLINFVFLFI